MWSCVGVTPELRSSKFPSPPLAVLATVASGVEAGEEASPRPLKNSPWLLSNKTDP